MNDYGIVKIQRAYRAFKEVGAYLGKDTKVGAQAIHGGFKIS